MRRTRETGELAERIGRAPILVRREAHTRFLLYSRHRLPVFVVQEIPAAVLAAIAGHISPGIEK